jgi:predicted component of type VI protein secretion system
MTEEKAVELDQSAYQTFARLHPVEAYDQDPMRFCEFVRTLKADMSDDAIKAEIDKQRKIDVEEKLDEARKQNVFALSMRGLASLPDGRIIKREKLCFKLHEHDDGRLEARDGTKYTRDKNGALHRIGKKRK